MAERTRKPGVLQRILAAIPRGSILGRVVHPMVEDRRTLAARMAWIGLFMLVGFLLVALLADVISPYDPVRIVDDANVPPLTTVVVQKNFTYGLAGPSNWTNVNDAKRDDGLFMTSRNASDVVVLRNFGFRPFTESLQRVDIIIQANSTPAAPENFVDAEITWDGGTTWSPAYRTALRTSDTGNGTNVFDVTGDARWTRQAVDDFHLQVRLTHTTMGGPPGPVSADYVRVRIAYLSGFHFMGTDNIGHDIFSRVLHGTRTSLEIMIIGVSVSLAVGFPLGLFSGFKGGNLDKVFVLFMDSLYSFPGLLLAGVFAVLLGKGVVNIGLAVMVIYVPLYFRVTRSQVLSVREEL